MATPIQSLYIDPQTLYVGIGTQRPQARLTVAGHICPSTTLTYDLGTSNLRFRDLYLSGNTLNLGGTSISRDPTTGGLKVMDPASGNAPLDMTVRTLSVGNIGIGTTFPRASLHINDTGALIIPSGTSEQIPISPIIGMIRYNTTINRLQLYANIGWISIGGLSASGGNTTVDVGGYRIHTFTSSGNFTVYMGGVAELLIVAGGGGGGTRHSGGGGAGGLIYTSAYYVEPKTYSVVIGGGGTGAGPTVGNGTQGQNSQFATFTAIGGGGGNGGAGGSGGGGNANQAGGAATSNQGNIGGSGSSTAPYGGVESSYAGGGGGGAGQVGGDAVSGANASGGNGGNGLQYNISNTLTYYAGGGGGSISSTSTGTAGSGGLGGGGAGSKGTTTATNGTSNTGGGGGAGGFTGASNAVAGNGGSGIVIIRYLL